MRFLRSKQELVKQRIYSFQKVGIILLSMAATMLSCSKEEDEAVVPNSPAYYIAAAKETLKTLPADITSDGEIVKILYATGVQKYKAVSSATSPTGFDWSTSSAPQAYLFDEQNAQVGTHYAGPFWELSDNDLINGQLVAGVDSPDGSANIKWLLLEPKTGTTPTGAFANVKHIQRINTVGGKPCSTPPADATSTCESDYQTVYIFRR